MRRWKLAVAALLFSAGCQAVQVADHATKLAQQAPTVEEQQVLDNLAKTAACPSSMPYFASFFQGQDQIARTATATYTPSWDFITSAGKYLGRYLLDKQSLALTGTNQNQESIQVGPKEDPDKLLLLQSAFHRALGIDDPYQDILTAALEAKVLRPEPPPNWTAGPGGKGVLVEQVHFPKKPAEATWQRYETMIAPGWLQVACKKDVPKHACMVGNYGDTCVYVLPGHEADLTRMTLAVLHLVSLDLTKISLPRTQTVSVNRKVIRPVSKAELTKTLKELGVNGDAEMMADELNRLATSKTPIGDDELERAVRQGLGPNFLDENRRKVVDRLKQEFVVPEAVQETVEQSVPLAPPRIEAVPVLPVLPSPSPAP